MLKYSDNTKIPDAVKYFFNYLEENSKNFQKDGLKIAKLKSAFNDKGVTALSDNYKPFFSQNFKDDIKYIIDCARVKYKFGNAKKDNFIPSLQQCVDFAEEQYLLALKDQMYIQHSAPEITITKDRLQLNRTASQIVKDIKRAMLNSISANEFITSGKAFMQSQSAGGMNVPGNIKARDLLNDMPQKLYSLNEKRLNQPIEKLLDAAFNEANENTSDEFKVDLSKNDNQSLISDSQYLSFVNKFLSIFEKLTIDIKGPEDLYMQMCEYEAVNDLITGKLHRLDPVIRDAGCQWRVPFIIDLYKAVKEKFPVKQCQKYIDMYDNSLRKNNLKNTMEIMLDIDDFIRRDEIIYRALGNIPTHDDFELYDKNKLNESKNKGQPLVDPATDLIEAIKNNNLANAYIGSNAAETGNITYASCEKELDDNEYRLLAEEIKKHNKNKAKIGRVRRSFFCRDIEARRFNDNYKPDVIWTGPDYHPYIGFADNEIADLKDGKPETSFNLKEFKPDNEYLDFFARVKEYINSLTFEDMVVFGEKTKQKERQGLGTANIWQRMVNMTSHYADENFNPVYLFNPSTMRYLTLCKTFTARQIRRMDTFGMSGVPTSLNAPCFDDSDMSAGQVELSYYSRCYLINAFERMLTDTNNQKFINSGLTNDKIVSKQPTTVWSMAKHLVEALKQANWYYICGKHHGHTAAYYENKRLLYMYCFLRDIPIIVDLKRLICEPKLNKDKSKKIYSIVAQSTGEVNCYEEATYTVMGHGIYNFKPDKELGRFVYSEKFDENQYGITIESHSMLNINDIELLQKTGGKPVVSKNFKDFEDFFKKEIDIVDQYLCATCTHPAANRSFRLNEPNLYGETIKKKGNKKEVQPTYTPLTDWTSKFCSKGNSDVDRFLENIAGTNLNNCSTIHNNYELVKRLPLPLFGNSYENDNWNICAERIFVASVAEAQNWSNHAYKNPVVDDLVQVRSTSSYIVSSTHIYGNNYKANFNKASKLLNRTDTNKAPLWKIPQGRLIELKDCEPLIY